jgi:hypothetical protein
VSIRSTPVSLLVEAGRNLIGTFHRTAKSNRHRLDLAG